MAEAEVDVIQFWNWFSSASEKLSRDIENADVLRQLDRKILEFMNGRLSWELGAGRLKENMLVISPSGNEDLLFFTDRIVRAAPQLPKWEFWSAKPAKNWNGTFEFETQAGESLRIESGRWEYVLLKFNDGTFDIVIKAPELCSLDEHDTLSAAEIALDGFIGEKDRIEAIKGVDVVLAFEESMSGKRNPFQVLAEHLTSLRDKGRAT